ncbi:glutamyl-tRNA reductase [Candidatus Nitrosoglobus terrae]|uniref:Glutamyl-tRNA reductase n=1 Tax=Candidatus Nitrosoglobus terrae TaxID=1630141 RepID=A0A1Q2SQ12_9GAMM|nr:glutamyl-tRNA reductase [Candidatus Nitrosoglobus terrae]BAW81179.1 glutamyl-tRNA reductase [Candidatus Nitrosoglobus terrae]
MQLLALGVNHKTASVAVREQITFTPENLPSALAELVHHSDAKEAAILSTCNRTELYCGCMPGREEIIIEWLRQYHHIEPKTLKSCLYTHPDQLAVRHLLRVASGLDSMILGEPQILGQIKTAYHYALEAGTVGRILGRLFQHTFYVAKQIRTDTAIGTSPVSIAFAAVSLAKQIFGNLEATTAFLIGAGETIELAARHLFTNGIGRIIVANRSLEKAHQLASQFNGYAIPLAEMPKHLPEADIVISSTASQLPILGKGAVERALRIRKRRPIFMVDIAVPRDIEPEVGELQDIYLYNVDDLQEVVQESLQSRQEAAKQAEEIIDAQVENFMEWIRAQNAIPIICAVRDQANQLCKDALEKARRRMASGDDPNEILAILAHNLTNKLLHIPSRQLRTLSATGDKTALEAALKIFDINHFKV